MSFSKKYYRKLKRTDEAKAEAYKKKCGVEDPVEDSKVKEQKLFSFDKIDTTWYDYPDNYVLYKKYEQSEADKQEIEELSKREGKFIGVGTIFDHEVEIGNLASKHIEAPIKMGNWYITVEYWVYLTKRIESLRKNQDWEGLVNLQLNIPIYLWEFKPANIESLINRMFEPPEEESDFEAENL